MSSTPVPSGAPASPEIPEAPEVTATAAPTAEPQPAEPIPAAPAAEPAGDTPEATDTPAAAAAPQKGSADPQACAAALKQLFPALFGGTPKPVKLRIQADIQERAPGQFTKQQLSAFLRRHTGGTSYLIALTRAKHRFDLDGQPAGELSDEHRNAAQEELTRRRGITQARRAEEDNARQQRAQLLRDFSRTTLTPANFCALKGIAADQLDVLLAQARQEEAEQPPRPPRDEQRRGPRTDGPRGGERQARGDGGPRGEHAPRGDRGPRPDRGGDGAPRNGGNGGNGGKGAGSRDGRRPPRPAR